MNKSSTVDLIGAIILVALIGGLVMVSAKKTSKAAFHGNVIALAQANENFRKEVYTSEYAQVVLMSLIPGGEIGSEVHEGVDQYLFFVSGTGQAILNGSTSDIKTGDLIVVPAGIRHNFINTGSQDLKLYTIYAPAQHKPGTIHKTKADADADEHEHEH